MEGKIYMIHAAGSKQIYIGSTITSLRQRWYKHKFDFLHNAGACSSKKLMNEYGLENCKIQLLYNFPCETKLELKREEGRQQLLNDCVNKNRAGRTSADYRAENLDKIHEHDRVYSRKYYEDNREALKLKMREYYKKKKLNQLGAKTEDSLTSGTSDF